jgi:hypothetical protein
MQKCLVLCKTLDIFANFYGQENGQMGKIVDKISFTTVFQVPGRVATVSGFSVSECAYLL